MKKANVTIQAHQTVYYHQKIEVDQEEADRLAEVMRAGDRKEIEIMAARYIDVSDIYDADDIDADDVSLNIDGEEIYSED